MAPWGSGRAGHSPEPPWLAERRHSAPPGPSSPARHPRAAWVRERTRDGFAPLSSQGYVCPQPSLPRARQPVRHAGWEQVLIYRRACRPGRGVTRPGPCAWTTPPSRTGALPLDLCAPRPPIASFQLQPIGFHLLMHPSSPGSCSGRGALAPMGDSGCFPADRAIGTLPHPPAPNGTLLANPKQHHDVASRLHTGCS